MKARHLVRVLLTLAILSAQQVCWASVGSVSVAELARQADCIALARVDGVRTVDGLKVAKVSPQKVWKGNLKSGSVYLVAEPMWTCDTSTAKPGETVLLFMRRAKGPVVERRFWRKPPARVRLSPLFFIAHSGRGRMPLRVVGGKTYVTLWTGDVTLPSHIKTIAGSEARYADFIRSAPLADITQAIAQKQRAELSARARC
jgi:hypothetical protein